MKRVSIDGACLLPPKAGVARYLEGLLAGLREVGTGDLEIEVLRPEKRRMTLRWVVRDLQQASRDFECLHLPFYYPPPAPRCPVVCAVHDVLVLEHPEWFPRPWADLTALMIRRGVRRAEAIVTASRYVASRIETLCGLSGEKIEIMPYGVDRTVFAPPSAAEIRAILEEFGIERPFVLQMGSFEQRRGLDLALEAVTEVRVGYPNLDLVLVGEVRARVDELSDPPQWVRRLGRVDDVVLPALFAGAEAVLSPSRDEGFDFPLLEALTCGAVVVASDIPVHREHFEPAVVLFESGRADALAAGIRTVLEDVAVAVRRRKAVDHASRFSWENVARRHLDLWRRVVR